MYRAFAPLKQLLCALPCSWAQFPDCREWSGCVFRLTLKGLLSLHLFAAETPIGAMVCSADEVKKAKGRASQRPAKFSGYAAWMCSIERVVAAVCLLISMSALQDAGA